MKIKNIVLLDKEFVDALVFFSKQLLPIAVSYMLDKCFPIIQKELESFNKSREDLIKAYAFATHNEDGSVNYEMSRASQDNQKQFWSEFNDLIGIEFELPIENKLELSFKKVPDLVISSEYLNKLKVLIDFKE